MLGFRFFWIPIMAFCLCLTISGKAYAEDAGALNLRFAAAASAKIEKTRKYRGESGYSKAQSGAKSAKRKISSTRSSRSKSSAPAKRRKRASLPPASAELPQSGIASWVGRSFHGRPVANSGEAYDMEAFTAAHRAIAFGSILKVTDMRTGRSVLVRVNDRGPYVRGRVIDLSRAAAEHLGFADRGVTSARLEFAGSDNDSAQSYYIRMRPAGDADKGASVNGFGPFDKFDEAASLFSLLYKSYPDAELLIVRKKG